MPIEANVQPLPAGDTKTYNVTLKFSNGSIVDLNGKDVYWVLSDTKGSPSIIEKNTVDGGIQIMDASNGEARISLKPSDTESLSGRYYHEAEVRGAFGEFTVFKGNLEIEKTSV